MFKMCVGKTHCWRSEENKQRKLKKYVDKELVDVYEYRINSKEKLSHKISPTKQVGKNMF